MSGRTKPGDGTFKARGLFPLAGWFVAMAGVGLSAAAWFQVRDGVEHEARRKFEAATLGIGAAAQARIGSYSDLLYGLQGLFQVEPFVSRAAFERYVYSLNLPVRYPGVRAVTYARRVPQANRPDYEMRLRRDPDLARRGYQWAGIRPEGVRREYLVLTYVEPFHPNKGAIGFDLVSDPTREAAIVRARDGGMPIASERTVLAVDPQGRDDGIVLRLALFRQDAFTPTVEERREAFAGLANLTFLVHEFAEHLLYPPGNEKFILRVYDRGYVDSPAPGDGDLLYTNAAARPEPGGGPLFENMREIEVGQRRWALGFSALRRDFAAPLDRVLPWGVAAAVLAVSLMLVGLLRSAAGSAARANALAAEMTADLRRSEAALAESQRRTQELLEVLPNPVYFKDTQGRYLGVNRAWETFFGLPREAFLGKTVHDLYPDNPDVAHRLHADDQALWARPGSRSYETAIATSHGKLHDTIFYKATFTGADGSVGGLIGTIVDITERVRAERAVEALQAELREQAIRDPLTGLYNRRYLAETLGRELSRAERHEERFSVIAADIDHFKAINDTHGHPAGDEVLKAFAELLRSNSRGSDIPCRQGGEEFLLILPDMGLDSARARAEQLRTAFAALRVACGATRIEATASFGVAAFPDHGRSAEQLIAAADAALYAAKAAGRDRVVAAPVAPAR